MSLLNKFYSVASLFLFGLSASYLWFLVNVFNSPLVETVEEKVAVEEALKLTDRFCNFDITYPEPIDLDPRVVPDPLWQLYFSGKPDIKLPAIEIKGLYSADNPQKLIGCTFSVKKAKAPEGSFDGLDWRYGAIFSNTDIHKFSGGTFSFDIRSTGNLTFPKGSIYLAQGNTFLYGSSIEHTDNSWENLQFPFIIDPLGGILEVWIRLAIHGPIVGQGQLDFKNLEIQFH